MELLKGIILGLATAALTKAADFSKDWVFYTRSDVSIALIFAALVLIGHQRILWAVTAGMTMLGTYDIFYKGIPYITKAPDRWPPFCLGFDVVPESRLLWALRQSK